MRRFLFAAFLLAGCTEPAVETAAAQVASDVEDWYLWTDDGVRLYVAELGEAAAPGDTVVVLHGGFGAEHSYLLDAVRPHADTYRFVLYDQRGSLRSPAADSLITYERMVADLEDLRVELGLEQLTLLGHSMGSFLAGMYLARHPERVKGLVLTGPVLFTDSAEELLDVGADTAAVFAAHEAWRAQAEAHVAAERAEEGLDRDDLTGRERTAHWRIAFTGFNAWRVDRWRDMKGGMAFYNGDASRALFANADAAGWDWPAERARIRAAYEAFGGPVRVIHGLFDFTDPQGLVWPLLVRLMPAGDLVLLEEAGHNAWLNRPDAFAEAITEALSIVTQ